MADPLFGTSSMHAAALFDKLGESEAKKFFEGFAANGGKILSSNGEVRRRVANGEFAVGLTDTDDYNEARAEGKPVGVVYPDAKGMGTVIVPNAVVLIAKGPNPEQAKKFIDFLLTPEVEKALADGEAAQIPVRAGVPVPETMVSLDRVRSMEIHYERLAGLLESLSKGYLKDWVDQNKMEAHSGERLAELWEAVSLKAPADHARPPKMASPVTGGIAVPAVRPCLPIRLAARRWLWCSRCKLGRRREKRTWCLPSSRHSRIAKRGIQGEATRKLNIEDGLAIPRRTFQDQISGDGRISSYWEWRNTVHSPAAPNWKTDTEVVSNLEILNVL